jgi:peptidoglycan hydrolase-like protein with peptidoglycan-binding domain
VSSDDAPELKVGDSGEGVVMLQVRLYQLKLYRQMPDGTFDMTTENAVRELQSQVGQDNSGEVTSETWDAILHVEQQYGIQYQYASPYDALDQLQYDLQNPSQASGNFPAGDPALSEDGQWRWDGNDWQPAAGADSVGGAVGQGPGQLSEDGQWRWDGNDWQPASGGGAGSADPQAGQLSEDGQWRWDGSQWQAAGGDGYSDGYSGQLSEDGQWRWDGSQWQAA